MTTQHSAIEQIALLAKSLRQQVADSRSPHGPKGRRKGSYPSSSPDSLLHDNLLSLLQLVDSLEEATSGATVQPPASSAGPVDMAAVSDRLVEPMRDALDRGLAGWQAQISMAYANGASQELADHLRIAERLSQSLQERENRLESQRKQLEENMAAVLQREARTERQRATIGQSLRARKAEQQLEMEQLLQQRTDQIRQELQMEFEQSTHVDTDELESLRREIESQRSQLDSQHSQLESQRSQLESQRSQLESQRSQLDTQRNELETHRSEQESLWKEHEVLLGEQETLRSSEQNLRQEADALRGELAETRQQLQELSSDDASQANDQCELISELKDQLAEAHTQLSQLHEQLESQSDTPLLLEAQTETIAELKAELEKSRHQLQDLQQQNSDLAATLAKHQVISTGNTPHASFQQESLSWEERKRLIMAQLEEETQGEEALSDERAETRLEIEQVLTTTEQEIQKRDREIAELQAIIEQQSDTRQGVAIGAAAFAQAFDNDEIIQQERQKLKEIQREWEEKLRQAEIDVSLERARLARERLQLEAELENTKREQQLADKEPEKAKKRKWLEHLGLRDETRS